uniref:Uncharacterized protein n=1 Tax=Anguilla anguilla TaxID=7936 RepID=A0A0E9WXU9_ANGAN
MSHQVVFKTSMFLSMHFQAILLLGYTGSDGVLIVFLRHPCLVERKILLGN